MPRTCFVVSPIGDPGTDTRRLADDLLELIIDPALESLGFDVIRADKIIGAGAITSDIVSLVQSADLCIIDLTGHNANVFYECGRRHETARPFIQVIRRGETPPFDVAGIRTIFYDLSDAREVRNTVLEMRQYAEAVVRNPSEGTRTSMSATSIADALDRLERKVDQLSRGQFSLTGTPASSLDSLDPFASLKKRNIPLSQLYFQAISQGDWEGASRVTSEMREKDGLVPYVIAAASNVAAAGQSAGADILYEALELDDLRPWAPDEDPDVGRDRILRALAGYYIIRDEESVGLPRLQGPIAELFADQDVPIESRGSLANSLNMLAYGAREYALGVEWGERACEILPKEPAYWVNLSYCYERLGNMVKARDTVDQALRDPLEESSSHTLDQAIDIYAELGDEKAVERFFVALKVVDPERARYKQFMRSLQKAE
jgi:tetratricopeptide (TPR) repeat protein